VCDQTSTYLHTDSIATTPSYTEAINNSAHASSITAANIDITTSLDMGCCFSTDSSRDSASNHELNVPSTGTLTTTCFTCTQPPAPGLSLLRCSRCKNAYYCSKSCQKTAWKLHKYDCERAGAANSPSPSSMLQTPDISNPASPVADDVAPTPLDGLPPMPTFENTSQDPSIVISQASTQTASETSSFRSALAGARERESDMELQNDEASRSGSTLV
jgi:hypothetical protein